MIPYTVACLRLSGYDVRGVVTNLARPLQATLVMTIFVWMCGEWLSVTPRIVRVGAQVATGVLVYGVVARDEIRWLIRQWRRA